MEAVLKGGFCKWFDSDVVLKHRVCARKYAQFLLSGHLLGDMLLPCPMAARELSKLRPRLVTMYLAAHTMDEPITSTTARYSHRSHSSMFQVTPIPHPYITRHSLSRLFFDVGGADDRQDD
ncbi:unnamed protein product, partial [Discosporangium mesarthrocarpum]